MDIDIHDTELASLQAAAQAGEAEPSDILYAVVKQGLRRMGQGRAKYGVEDYARPASKLDLSGLTLAERRAKRFALLQNSSGIWAGEPGKPRDGLLYQRELRAEWP